MIFLLIWDNVSDSILRSIKTTMKDLIHHHTQPWLPETQLNKLEVSYNKALGLVTSQYRLYPTEALRLDARIELQNPQQHGDYQLSWKSGHATTGPSQIHGPQSQGICFLSQQNTELLEGKDKHLEGKAFFLRQTRGTPLYPSRDHGGQLKNRKEDYRKYIRLSLNQLTPHVITTRGDSAWIPSHWWQGPTKNQSQADHPNKRLLRL